MSLLTIVLFFVYTFGLGFTLTNILKLKTDNFYEKNIMRVGFGLTVFAILTALLPLLRIPLDWRVILLLSIIYPIYYIFRNFKKTISYFKSQEFKRDIRPKLNVILLFVLFGFTFFMYHKGAFAYPYFEDEDPWNHAFGVKYISLEKTVYEPSADSHLFEYLDARPPAYGAILGVLHQTSPIIMWTMKFFNALIISLGIFFFFYFAKRIFNGSSNKALIATFFLAMFPTYLTHFIWGHALVMTLMFVGLYALLNVDEGWNARIIAMVAISSVFLTQETQSIKYVLILGLYFLARSITKKRFDTATFYTIIGAVAISLITWWIPMVIRYGGLSGLYVFGISQGVPVIRSTFSYVHPSLQGINYFGGWGSATRQHGVYTLSDMFFAKGQNMINVPIGVGIILMCLIILGVIYFIIKNKRLKERTNELALLFWIIFVFFGAHGGTRWWSPIALLTFRFWLLFAVFGSLVAVYGIYLLFSLFKPFKIPKIVILVLILVGVWFTSGAQKYELNTATWPPGGYWTSEEDLKAYLWFKTLPPETKVFIYSGRGNKVATSFGVFSCVWCEDELNFRKEFLYKNATELHSFLRSHNYKYLMLDSMSYKYLTLPKAREYKMLINDSFIDKSPERNKEIIDKRFEEISNSDLFKPVYATEGNVIFLVS